MAPKGSEGADLMTWSMPSIIGIDPGQSSGGIALLTPDRVEAWKLPATERDTFDLLDGLSRNAFAYIEQVHSMPTQGVTSTFKFGMSYGGLRMALIGAHIPFTEVTPGTWQRAMRCLTKGDKNVSKQRAQQLFPSLKITHATADALLIACYGWQMQSSNPWTGGEV
jgi:crossover junction endodeoxyribonuclease RuvC